MKTEILFSGFQQQLTIDQAPFNPRISLSEPRIGFNVVTIRLDASPRSLLKWHDEIDRAHRLALEGFYVLWELDFGFSETLFSDEALVLSRALAVDHFVHSVWNETTKFSFGALLYHGFYDEKRIEELLFLSTHLSEEITPFIFLDTTPFSDAASFFRSCRKELLAGFCLALKGEWANRFPYAFPFLGWECSSPLGIVASGEVLPQKKMPVAFCFTSEFTHPEIERLLDEYQSPVRVIYDRSLTQEWEGVEKLIVFSRNINSKLERKLAGFLAAGGEIDYVNYNPSK